MITLGVAYVTGGVVLFTVARIAELPGDFALRLAAAWPFHLVNLVVFSARLPYHRHELPKVVR